MQKIEPKFGKVERVPDVCGRCNKVIPSSWEHEWPLRGIIDLGLASQIFGHLCGARHCADEHHFRWWQEGHPAMTVNDAQRARFEWSHRHQWRLCYDCQKELIQLIGVFFRIPERAKELSQ